jgi:hypothetical protein
MALKFGVASHSPPAKNTFWGCSTDAAEYAIMPVLLRHMFDIPAAGVSNRACCKFKSGTPYTPTL